MPAPLEYHQVHRLGRPGVWRPIVGVVALVLGLFALSPLLWQAAFAIWFALTGQPVGEGLDRLLDVDSATPLTLTFVNLVLATAIPLSILINLALHGLSPGWLMSVARRIRWRFLVACFGLSVLALLATVVVSSFVPQGGGTELSGEANDFTSTTRDFLLVVLILTPLQAAGEEFAFRGYLMQAFGGVFGNRVVAVLLSSVLFALAHGLGQDLPIFVDRLAFGLVAGALVILTGGLEAGIAMHVLNNFLAFGLALAFTDMGSALNPTGGTWWSLPGTLTQSLVYLALATWLARRTGLETTTTPAILERSRGPV
ncbi:CPBP family intramembrane glutamic endopeptidase [Nocardioides currus]|uniref:CPBP family intramembrane metalloprotease domain-containing protein n=1 Tax=Nocardioides currus TaxID=2133958 RepID=A0A2R7YWY9_9ACTN|nr:CPBP family intramembrane glutamic endopeptidase [Nocardioides currus]PUA80824.1 CPBP family intramembrane metalloprotease domain-containing protein [Nocardioides currus]